MSLGQSLDTSLNIGEEIRFKQRHKKLTVRLSKELRLSYREIEHIGIIYYKLQKIGEGKNVPVRRSLIKDVLNNGFDMTEYDLLSNVLSVHDRNLSMYMCLESWIRMIAFFLRGSLEEKIDYCFAVYKSVGIHDKLVRNTLITLLKHSLIKDNNEDDEEAVKDLVDMLIKRMDFDRDGKISYEDFKHTVMECPSFLEAFGTVLPSRLAVLAFKTTITLNVGKK